MGGRKLIHRAGIISEMFNQQRFTRNYDPCTSISKQSPLSTCIYSSPHSHCLSSLHLSIYLSIPYLRQVRILLITVARSALRVLLSGYYVGPPCLFTGHMFTSTWVDVALRAWLLSDELNLDYPFQSPMNRSASAKCQTFLPLSHGRSSWSRIKDYYVVIIIIMPLC